MKDLKALVAQMPPRYPEDNPQPCVQFVWGGYEDLEDTPARILSALPSPLSAMPLTNQL